MSTLTISETERRSAALTVASWRTAAGQDNPAGPLYSAGVFAEAEMIEGDVLLSGSTTSIIETYGS